MKYVYILAGGALGSLIRFWVSEFVTSKYQSAFPTGIFFVNIVGALVIGFLFGLFTVNGQIEDRLRFLLFVGFLGGFTTFSSFAYENVAMLQQSNYMGFALYTAASVLCCLLAVFSGLWLCK